jgi:hypothetical protein
MDTNGRSTLHIHSVICTGSEPNSLWIDYKYNLIIGVNLKEIGSIMAVLMTGMTSFRNDRRSYIEAAATICVYVLITRPTY